MVSQVPLTDLFRPLSCFRMLCPDSFKLGIRDLKSRTKILPPVFHFAEYLREVGEGEGGVCMGRKDKMRSAYENMYSVSY